MKTIEIRNLRITADALQANSQKEAQQLIDAINAEINGWDSSPAIVFDGEIDASYDEDEEE